MANTTALQEMVTRQVEELEVLPLRNQLRVAAYMKEQVSKFGSFYPYERKLILKFLIEQDELYDKLNI